MSCTWLISLPKNKIQLSFSAFALQAPGPSCQDGDFVEVRDGEYPDSPVLGTFCGSNIPSDTFSSGSYMLVQFRSDESMEKRGFVTSYRSYDTSNGKVFWKNRKQRPCEAGDLRHNFISNYKLYTEIIWRLFDTIAYFTVNFSHLHYNVIQRGCEAISG